ncbi:hypothetical protein ASL14_14210 [Paenibacillus sp. IHB B 3084]|uniref:DUF6138 family protein n=1 Tax=Paenibacillus sp. IHB B 3084 TaxID=867076 RepID=UPI000721E672|nr:DUF6138 family protein [Paenibacillus sp. IHB B 3084]ALP37160.1 hypothetical protein ASL14_14210 [Paenibacillus sp. IHB B 3084]
MASGVQAYIDPIFEAIDKAYASEQKRIAEFQTKSVLHEGIHEYLKVTCKEDGLWVDTYEPFDWDNRRPDTKISGFTEGVTLQQVQDEWMPVFRERIEALFKSEECSPMFFRYRLEFHLEVALEKKSSHFTFSLLNEDKRQHLLAIIQQFVEQKLNPASKAVPKEKDDFFFVRHMLDPHLYPIDAQRMDELLNRMDAKVKVSRNREEAWRHQLNSGLKRWAEDEFLAKSDIHPSNIPAPAMEMFLLTAMRVGSTDADARQKYLEIAAQLGSEQAAQWLKSGSGSIPALYTSERVACQANDILQTLEVHILSEEEESYREALVYVCDILQKGFTKEYRLKLKSKVKNFLPVPKLAKSTLHRFFANALEYPALHPLLAEYADMVMEEFKWYNDVEPGEKSAMPGTYVVMGLGLKGTDYFPLVIRYMKLVDTEHQSVQDGYAAVFADAHGLTPDTIPVWTKILLAGNQSAKPLKSSGIESVEQARVLVEELEKLEDYDKELLVYRIWGGEKKLKSSLKQAAPEVKALLESLIP